MVPEKCYAETVGRKKDVSEEISGRERLQIELMEMLAISTIRAYHLFPMPRETSEWWDWREPGLQNDVML